jgi:hypothetical protein
MSLPMQKATYQARAIGSGFGSSSNGNTQIAVQLEVIAPDQEDPVNGERIAWIGHFTDKTTDRTIESLQHLGWKGDDLAELEDENGERALTLFPDTVEIVCEPEEYDGNWRLRVKWINKPGGSRFTFKEPLTGQALKSFAAQMKGTIRNAQQGGVRKPSSAPPQQLRGYSNSGGGSRHPNAPGNGNDDIPF